MIEAREGELATRPEVCFEVTFKVNFLVTARSTRAAHSAVADWFERSTNGTDSFVFESCDIRVQVIDEEEE